MNAVIRPAAASELGDFLPLLHNMHRESAIKWPSYDDRKILGALEQCFETGCVFGAFDVPHLPVGILALAEGEHWFSTHKFLGDLVFYVHPNHRRSTVARRLLEAGKRLATDSGLPLMLAVVDGRDVERKDAFYERGGFNRIGGVFAYNFKE